MKKLLLAAVAGIAAVGLMVSSAHAAYVVDGSVLSDWGIDLAAASPIGYLNSNLPTSATANWNTAPEDETNVAQGWVQVHPGWSYGNQYDAEALYFDNDHTSGYIAVISGLSETGWGWKPGDIGIDLDGDLDYDYGISITTKKLYSGVTWEGPFYHTAPNDFSAAAPWRISSFGAEVADVDLVYSLGQNSHYVIETSFLLSDLNLGNLDTLNLHWSMECGNDFVNTTGDVNTTPEPATMTLLGMGLLGVFGLRRKAVKG